jgi:hypothetical protein
MYGAEEAYFRGLRVPEQDALLRLIEAGTDRATGTIRRTGENLAAVYGEMPRELGRSFEAGGRGVSNFVKGRTERQERERRHEFEDEESELRQLNIESATRRGEMEKAEEAFMNEGAAPAGGRGPMPPPGLGMTRRQAKLAGDFEEYQAGQGHQRALRPLELKGAEEGLLTSAKGREATDAQIRLNNAQAGALARSQSQAEKARLLEETQARYGALMSSGDQAAAESYLTARIGAGLDQFDAQLVRSNTQKAMQQASFTNDTLKGATPEGQAAQSAIEGARSDVNNLGALSTEVGRYRTAAPGFIAAQTSSDAQESLQKIATLLRGLGTNTPENANFQQIADKLLDGNEYNMGNAISRLGGNANAKIVKTTGEKIDEALGQAIIATQQRLSLAKQQAAVVRSGAITGQIQILEQQLTQLQQAAAQTQGNMLQRNPAAPGMRQQGGPANAGFFGGQGQQQPQRQVGGAVPANAPGVGAPMIQPQGAPAPAGGNPDPLQLRRFAVPGGK